jgi:hypothetical protein
MLIDFSDRDVKTRPYFLVGFGATNLDPDEEGVEGTTKFSFGLGAGVKVNLSPRVGARAVPVGGHVRLDVESALLRCLRVLATSSA